MTSSTFVWKDGTGAWSPLSTVSSLYVQVVRASVPFLPQPTIFAGGQEYGAGGGGGARAATMAGWGVFETIPGEVTVRRWKLETLLPRVPLKAAYCESSIVLSTTLCCFKRPIRMGINVLVSIRHGPNIGLENEQYKSWTPHRWCLDRPPGVSWRGCSPTPLEPTCSWMYGDEFRETLDSGTCPLLFLRPGIFLRTTTRSLRECIFGGNSPETSSTDSQQLHQQLHSRVKLPIAVFS